MWETVVLFHKLPHSHPVPASHNPHPIQHSTPDSTHKAFSPHNPGPQTPQPSPIHTLIPYYISSPIHSHSPGLTPPGSTHSQSHSLQLPLCQSHSLLVELTPDLIHSQSHSLSSHSGPFPFTPSSSYSQSHSHPIFSLTSHRTRSRFH